MKDKLLAYALHFTSFLIENGIAPNRVILFGSVARGDFDKNSDIDIFIDLEESEKEKVMAVKNIFMQTLGDKWALKGVSNPISLVVGNLDSKKWGDLKRSIQSNGIVLYGGYVEQPRDTKPYFLLRLNFAQLPRSAKIRIWRTLYGYSQKVGNKKYVKKGLLRELGGRKIDKSVVIIPTLALKELKPFLMKNKVDFSIYELWSDNL